MSGGTQIISGKVANPGLYGSVNLNGWTLASERPPPTHTTVLLGYRVPHLPEVWFGVGFRDGNGTYWLGSRGLDPNYQKVAVSDLVIWRSVDWPFACDETRLGTSGYLQWRYILGEQPTTRTPGAAGRSE